MHVDLGNRQAKADQAQPVLTQWVLEFRKGAPMYDRIRNHPKLSPAQKIARFKKLKNNDAITDQAWQLWKELKPYFEKEEDLDT